MTCVQQAPGVTRGKILRFIRSYIQRQGVSPTLREIADGAGLRSVGTVAAHLRRMEADGLLTHVPGSPRSVAPIQRGEEAPARRVCVRSYCMLPAGCTLRDVRLTATVVDRNGRMVRKVSSQSVIAAEADKSSAG